MHNEKKYVIMIRLSKETESVPNKGVNKMKYDVIIIGAGPGGIFSAYELSMLNPNLKVAVFEAGHPLHKRKCP